MTKRKSKQARAVRQAVYKALSHELRTEVWTYLIENSSGSPSEIAHALEEPVSEVSQQIRQLVDYGLVEFAGTRPSERGSPQKVYRCIVRPLATEEEVEEMLPPARHGLAGQCIQATMRDVNAASKTHAFAKRSDWHLTRTLLSLDQEGFQELKDLYGEVLQRILDIEAESNARLLKSSEESVRASASLLCFAMR